MECVAYINTDTGDCVELPAPGTYSFGRGSTSDFRPNTKSVSKRHAILELLINATTGKVEAWIEDLNSTFGTYVGVTPTTVEKIVERTRLFYGLYIRFGHAPLCYKYLESPEIEEPEPALEVLPISVPLPVPILELDDVSVNASVSSKARRSKKRTIPLRITSPTDEEVALQLHQSLNDSNSPRPRIKDLVDKFEHNRTPGQTPDAKNRSSGNFSDTQVVAGLVSKYETSTNVSPINISKGPSPEGSFNSNNNNDASSANNTNNAKPSPETSSKSHNVENVEANEKSLFTLSPDSSFHSKNSDASFKELSSSSKDPYQQLRVDTFSEYRLEVSPTFTDSERTVPAVQEEVREEEHPAPANESSSRGPSPLGVHTVHLSPSPSISPSTVAPGKEGDSAKELDYSIYDYDLDEKHGAEEMIPPAVFRRNPSLGSEELALRRKNPALGVSLWEDPALFDAIQYGGPPAASAQSPRPTRSTPPALFHLQSPRASIRATNTPEVVMTNDELAALALTQRALAVVQARRAFMNHKTSAMNPAASQYPTYSSAAKQWTRAIASVDTVEDGMCLWLVLPFLRKVKIEPCGKKKQKIRLDARRLVQHGDDVATDRDSEYLCEFKLEGVNSAIKLTDISHEYCNTTGLLCVYVDRLQVQDSQLFTKKRGLLTGAVAYEPVQTSKGSGMFKWIPGWMKGNHGRTERMNEQELQRALKSSASETTSKTPRSNTNKTPRANKTPRSKTPRAGEPNSASGSGGSENKPKTPSSGRSNSNKTPRSGRAAGGTNSITSPRAGVPPRPAAAPAAKEAAKDAQHPKEGGSGKNNSQRSSNGGSSGGSGKNHSEDAKEGTQPGKKESNSANKLTSPRSGTPPVRAPSPSNPGATNSTASTLPPSLLPPPLQLVPDSSTSSSSSAKLLQEAIAKGEIDSAVEYI